MELESRSALFLELSMQRRGKGNAKEKPNVSTGGAKMDREKSENEKYQTKK